MEQRLIELLADGQFHSGEQLGWILGVSRAAVWKRLQKLESLGLQCERVRGKGYRLPGGIRLLDEEYLRREVAASPAGLSVRVVEATGSTNADLLAQVESGIALPSALLAEFQSAGRGRRGRAWMSPYGRSLYLSLAWPFHRGASQLEGLSLVVGSVLAELLSEQGGLDVGLKWPNDVLVRGRKMAGVLIELSGDIDGRCVAVIGIGLNGSLPEAHGSQIDQAWTDMERELGEHPDRNQLAADLLVRLADTLPVFSEQGFAALRPRWERFDLCRNRPVRIQVGERLEEGVARGITSSGALEVVVGGVSRVFHGGEVSLRLA